MKRKNEGGYFHDTRIKKEPKNSSVESSIQSLFDELLNEIVNNNPRAVKELLQDDFRKHKINPDQLYYSRNQNPLHIAAAIGNEEIINILLDEGINPLARNAKDFTPAFVAIANKQTKALIALLSHPSGISHKHLGPKRRNLLQFAIHGESEECFRYLLDNFGHDSDFINYRDLHNETPLHKAVLIKSPSFVKQLLAYNPLLNIMNRVGLTPKQCAEQRNYSEIVELLKNYPGSVEKNLLTTLFSPQREPAHYPNLESLQAEIDSLTNETRRLHEFNKSLAEENLILRQHNEILAQKVLASPEYSLTALLTKTFLQTAKPATPKFREDQPKQSSHTL